MHLVELGFRCNNACVFCAQGRIHGTDAARALETLEAEVDAAPVHGPLAFVGGEPTLVEELGHLVERARDRGIARIIVQTHARRLAAPGVAKSLAQAGVTSLEVSLLGDGEALHDYHAGAAGSFRQTITGIRRARAARLAVAISVVVTRSNLRHLSGIVRVAHTLGAEAVRFALAEPCGAGSDDAMRLIVDRRMAWPHLARAFELARTLGLAFASPDFELSSHEFVEQYFAFPARITGPASSPSAGPGVAPRRVLAAPQPPSHLDHHASHVPGW